MRIHLMKDGKPEWRTWKDSSKCTEGERKQANLRQIKRDEIVLDADKTSLSDIISKLKDENFSFSAYKHRQEDTGHVHMAFPQLKNYGDKDRKLIRNIIIEHFNCDPAKSSDNTMIAWEGRVHFKNGSLKQLVDEEDGENEIPEWVINAYHEKKAEITPAIDVVKLLEGVRKGQRNFATVVIATHYRRQGISEEEATRLLLEWNFKNQPPEDERLIRAAIRGAYKPPTPYAYRFKGESSSTNQVTRLVTHLQEFATFFHDQFNNGFMLTDGRRVFPIRSREMISMLSKVAWDTERSAPSTNTINSAVNLLEALALFDGEMITLDNRVTERDGKFYYDMTDDLWRVVEITPEEWQILEEHPPMFKRYKHQQPQHEPKKGTAKLDDFLSLTTITDEDYRLLLKVYIVSSFIPGISHAIIVPYGAQGSTKTFLMSMIRTLIDPSSLNTQTFPRDKNELIQMLDHHYCAYFDNITSMTSETSNILCMAVTGSGFTKRVLYTDDHDFIYSYRRVIGLNGINNPSQSPDLLDRCILFKLERVDKKERKLERVLWKQFNEIRGSVLYDIFNTVSRAMKLYPSVDISGHTPRMADFATWGEAIARALGYPEFEFIRAYHRNMEHQTMDAIESHIIGSVVLEFMKGRNHWTGTSTQLLANLEDVAKKSKINTTNRAWPKAPNALSRRMNEIKTNLEEIGLNYYDSRTSTSANKVLKWNDDAWERVQKEQENASKENNKPQTEQDKNKGVMKFIDVKSPDNEEDNSFT